MGNKKAVWIKYGHWEENKKATIASGLRKSLILMVPEAGIEPARLEKRGILKANSELTENLYD
ncbi:hypothetical protein [Aeromonas salmonicida]|uniref:hypothetical protein n=1 Tax=Aeromonas salmonicida TaxID=645 RepID=UPI002240AE99|nr:hypothetical protein [Aeromonas salmonicida]